jgi:hypothetical protein
VRAIPDLKALQDCKDHAKDSNDFDSCLVDKVLPKEYRLVRQCISDNPNDHAAAAICSSGNSTLMTAYKKFNNVKTCVDRVGPAIQDVAGCAGQQFLGSNEQYYLGCVIIWDA